MPELEPSKKIQFHDSNLDMSAKKRKHAEIRNDTMRADPDAIDELMYLFQEGIIDATTTADDVYYNYHAFRRVAKPKFTRYVNNTKTIYPSCKNLRVRAPRLFQSAV